MSLIEKKLERVKLLAMDFDGIHTDGFVYVSDEGHEMVRCSRRDGLGLEMLGHAGIKLCVISKEKNPVVEKRCAKLGIEVYQGVVDGQGKQKILESLAIREKIDISEVGYIGDDINDLEALMYAGISVTVADGHPELKKHADIVLTRKGGEHAVRELCDLILEIKQSVK